MIKVYFDSTQIGNDNIVGLTQSVNPYEQNFKIGNTICRTFNLKVAKAAFSSTPSKVYLYEENTLYATLYVDDVNKDNDQYVELSLVDGMVMFNKAMAYTTNQTVKQILENICAAHGFTLATSSFYMDSFQITWQDDIDERDFISYVAEVNGGYAYINASGNLVIQSYSNIATSSINTTQCSSFKLGNHHIYDRVYVELASATKFYPSSHTYDTLYLNPANILFNDAQGFTIDGIIQHIYGVINGLDFYNIKIEKCPIQSSLTGELISVVNGNNTYKTICTIEYDYNAGWIGGYDFSVNTSKQEETQVVTTTERVNRLSIKVDRDKGIIQQQITDLSTQTTASLALKLDKTDNDQVISMINASADNIVLNTKSLIFGVYPSGQYIEVKNYYENSVAKGVLFDGSGKIIMEPEGEYIVSNKVDGEEYNTFAMTYSISGGNVTSKQIVINNYDYLSGAIANQIEMYSGNPGNNIGIANRKQNGDVANWISLDESSLILYNSATKGRYQNKIELSDGDLNILAADDLRVISYNISQTQIGSYKYLRINDAGTSTKKQNVVTFFSGDGFYFADTEDYVWKLSFSQTGPTWTRWNNYSCVAL